MTARRPAPAPLADEQRRVLATLTPAQRASPVKPRGRRKASERELPGLPLYSLALGPDLLARQTRGHAKGVVAIGDVATGGAPTGTFVAGPQRVDPELVALFDRYELSFALPDVRRPARAR